jgi:hypothetical protein
MILLKINIKFIIDNNNNIYIVLLKIHNNCLTIEDNINKKYKSNYLYVLDILDINNKSYNQIYYYGFFYIII